MSLTAIGIVLLSAAIHAFWNYLYKTAPHPRAYTAVKGPYTFALLIVVLVLAPVTTIPPMLWVVIFFSGFVETLYFFGLASAYTHGDISLVYPIARSAPALIPIVAVPLLGERLSIGGVAGILVVVAAMWVVNTNGRFTRRAFFAPGAGYAYFTLLTVVTYSLLDKFGMARFSAVDWTGPIPKAMAYVVIQQMIAQVLYYALVVPRLPREEVQHVFRTQQFRAFVNVAGEMLSYGLILYVYQSEPVSYVVTVRQTSVIMAVLLGTILLREPFGRIRLIGSMGIVFGVFLIARFA